MRVGCHFNIKPFSRHGYFHHKDKTVAIPSHLYQGNPYTGKMSSLYWDTPWARYVQFVDLILNRSWNTIQQKVVMQHESGCLEIHALINRSMWHWTVIIIWRRMINQLRQIVDMQYIWYDIVLKRSEESCVMLFAFRYHRITATLIYIEIKFFEE